MASLSLYKRAIDEIRQGDYTVDTMSTAVRKILDLKSFGVPVQVIELCKGMGFAVFQQDLPEGVRGYVVLDGELKDRFGTDRVIVVNANDSVKTRRFTVAHELGHFLFDFDPNTIQFYHVFEGMPF